ncbi:FepA family TonB-dependent siderophore receptor [Pseudochelatococcus contaminans]|uniref:Ferric enterobactin receptor n=1 Tax=Pseudochelatococcus contaminans TaxID=1538103 RepID=A0A7W5Z827_9HYPH|nr:FepA family TonB-dependent siderophore receptor [Pseudochelatococcus contaminans]MBB3811374.1 ferric enterobactin receptor [Pseudochelatococcus contaminans]
MKARYPIEYRFLKADVARRGIAGLYTATAMVAVLMALVDSAWAQDTRAQRAETNAELPLTGEELLLDEVVVVSAREQLSQAPGVSIIGRQQIEMAPPVNDLSDVIRRQPGVNLTGNSAGGQRGNNRQIDIRGMGPENTLILIDGKPVLSRNSVRMRRGGERDTRGDSNWVPAELVDRIEVLRGPAAARYGSGASGGVVNIITRRPEKQSFSATTFANIPENSDEGRTYRSTIVAGGPIDERFSYRISANYNRTGADNIDINQSATPFIPVTDWWTGAPVLGPDGEPLMQRDQVAAGREGVVNTDFRGLLSWKLDERHVLDFEAAWSQQRNIYAGDTLFSDVSVSDLNQELARGGHETNRVTRTTLSATHRGKWDFGTSNTFIQWENAKNRRLGEAEAGRSEGIIDSRYAKDRKVITLDNVTAKSEWNFPLNIVVPQTLTAGVEFRGEWMDDENMTSGQEFTAGGGVNTVGNPELRNPKSQSQLYAVYLEDNILVTDKFILTPGLRFDHHSESGNNWSPSLNASYALTDELTLKAGIARAFKAPNLFQTNPNYIYNSRGNGCPYTYGGPCYVVGNPNLKAETSINKEVGIGYINEAGWNAGITYFHNDFKDHIQSGTTPVGRFNNQVVYQWENVPKAVIQGLEGNLIIPVHEKVTWSTNATYMIESKNKTDGQPLSLVPKYTINSNVLWKATEQLELNLGVTHYGKIDAPTVDFYTLRQAGNTRSRSPYTLVNVGARYEFNENLRLLAGVTNLFDKSVKREGTGNAAGANTFNEPGRAYYISLTGSF